MRRIGRPDAHDYAPGVDISDHHMTVEADAVRASRQAGVLFLMSGLLAVVGIPTTPEHTGVLCGIAAAALSWSSAAGPGRAAPWSTSSSQAAVCCGRRAHTDELEPGGVCCGRRARGGWRLRDLGAGGRGRRVASASHSSRTSRRLIALTICMWNQACVPNQLHREEHRHSIAVRDAVAEPVRIVEVQPHDGERRVHREHKRHGLGSVRHDQAGWCPPPLTTPRGGGWE